MMQLPVPFLLTKVLIMAHPLLCWDIVEEGMSRRAEFRTDIDILYRIQKENCWHFIPERSLDNCLVWENKTIIITTTSLKIVFASKNIYHMNGYTPGEVTGRSPKIFQGKNTSYIQRQYIGNAIKSIQPFDTTIVNYRKDGSMYNCHIEGYPVFNNRQQLVNFIALENIVYDK